MKTAFILGIILLIGILSLYGLYKYSGLKLPTVNGDQYDRIEALENQVRDLTISQIEQAKQITQLAENQLRIAQLLEYKQKGYIWE